MHSVKEMPSVASARGADSRQRLLEVALDVFGQHGFDGASTREIVQKAGANLTAIPYYFGGKEGLYMAAVEYMVSDCVHRMAPAMERTREEVGDSKLSRGELIERLCDLLDDFAAKLMGPQMPDHWSILFAREQMQPTAAFDKISAGFRPFMDLLRELVGRIVGQSPDDPDTRLRVLTIFGQIMIFRTNRATVLRVMNWQKFGEPQLRAVQLLIRKQVTTVLEQSK